MPSPGQIQRTYLVLLLGNTLAASLIWGINTIFLLDAGLSNLEAFAANAFFTAGMVLFEVPTGIVADTVGRRASYLLGTLTLAVSTLLYVAALADRGAVLGVGDRLDPDRPRVHVLLRRGRGVARRRAHRDRLHRRAGVRLRARPDRQRASRCWPARWRAGSSPRSGASACRSCCAASMLVVMFVVAFRVMRDIGFTPEPGRPAARRDAEDRRRLDRLRLARARGQVADGRVAVHGRRRDLRLLRAAAVPARALGRPARRTRSPASWRRSSPARRSSAGSRRRGSGAASAGAPRRCSRPRRSSSLTLALIGVVDELLGPCSR